MSHQQFLTSRFAAIFLAALSVGSGASVAQTAEPEGDEATFPVVITPTRLRQSLADVPASVTVISAETIRRYGITRLEDALRLVPGMAVSQATGNDFRINYHGTNMVSPRRMNVLVDGVSVYRPAFSRVEWSLMPVAMEDVASIEVIRGPDSAAHGPNSMMAVVNILTKHPQDVERGLVSVSGGSHGALDTTLRMATTIGPTHLRVTANTRRDSGYDHIDLPGDGRDSTQVKRLNVRAQTALSDGSSLDLQASLVDANFQLGFIDMFQASYPDRRIRDMQVSGRWTKPLSADHELQIDLYQAGANTTQRWRTCWPQLTFLPQLANLFDANPQYVVRMAGGDWFPTGGTANDDVLAAQARQAIAELGFSALQPTCGQTNQDGSESRTQLELQDTYVLSPQWRFVSGLGLRYQRADSATYFGGSVGNNVRWAFGHAEYRPTDWLTANLGGYLEHNSISGRTFSPRLALNARLTEHQTLRAVVSKGTRTPDLFEERANWSYTLTGLTVPVAGSSTGRLFTSARAKSDLSSERIWSRELGYLLTLPRAGLILDARVFDDHLSGLISDHLTLLDFAPQNIGSVHLTGLELQASWEISPDWSALWHHAYLLNRDRSGPVEASQYSRHSGAIGLTHALTSQWRASALHTFASGDGINESRYGRTDLTVSRAWPVAGSRVLASLSLSHLSPPQVQTFRNATNYFTSSYDDPLSIHGHVRLSF